MSPLDPTKEIIDALCEARGRGLSVRESCRRAGISVNTYYRWKVEAEAYAFFDDLRAKGWTFEEIEALVAEVERRRGYAA